MDWVFVPVMEGIGANMQDFKARIVSLTWCPFSQGLGSCYTKGRKPVNIISPCPLLQFLPLGSCLDWMDYD